MDSPSIGPPRDPENPLSAVGPLLNELESLQRRNRLLVSTLARTQAEVRSILESRIWKALVAAAGLLLRVLRAAGFAKQPPPEAGNAKAASLYPSDAEYRQWLLFQDDSPIRFARLKLALLPSPPSIDVIPVSEESRWNAAVLASAADWFILLPEGDSLTGDALLHFSAAVADHPGASIIYSDHDCLAPDGLPSSPRLKPDWSPLRFLAEDYVGPSVLIRRSLFDTLGGFRDDVPDWTLYEFLLRADLSDSSAVHVHRVLYHHRDRPDSRDHASRAGLVSSALTNSSGGDCSVRPSLQPDRLRVEFLPSPAPSVTIVIPTGGAISRLELALQAVLDRDSYPNASLLVVDNSHGSEVASLCASRGTSRIPVSRLDRRGRPFNFSALCNEALSAPAADFRLFLNDDIEALHSDWLLPLVGSVSLPGVAIAGPLLLYPSGLIQHAGVTTGVGLTCEHTLKDLGPDHPHYQNLALVQREVSAVTGACLLIRSAVFESLGGFDSLRYPINFNDIDLCFRARRAGHRIVYTPFCRLRHHELSTRAQSRQVFPSSAELTAIGAQWRLELRSDPYYNANLNSLIPDYTLAQPDWPPLALARTSPS